MDEIVRHCVLSSEGHVSDDEKSNYVGEDVLLSIPVHAYTHSKSHDECNKVHQEWDWH